MYNEPNAAIAALTEFKALNENGVYGDPMLAYAPIPTSLIDGYDFTELCSLSKPSPVLQAGKVVQGVEKDILENPYKQSIGCYCG